MQTLRHRRGTSFALALGVWFALACGSGDGGGCGCEPIRCDFEPITCDAGSGGGSSGCGVGSYDDGNDGTVDQDDDSDFGTDTADPDEVTCVRGAIALAPDGEHVVMRVGRELVDVDLTSGAVVPVVDEPSAANIRFGADRGVLVTSDTAYVFDTATGGLAAAVPIGRSGLPDVDPHGQFALLPPVGTGSGAFGVLDLADPALRAPVLPDEGTWVAGGFASADVLWVLARIPVGDAGDAVLELERWPAAADAPDARWPLGPTFGASAAPWFALRPDGGAVAVPVVDGVEGPTIATVDLASGLVTFAYGVSGPATFSPEGARLLAWNDASAAYGTPAGGDLSWRSTDGTVLDTLVSVDFLADAPAWRISPAGDAVVERWVPVQQADTADTVRDTATARDSGDSVPGYERVLEVFPTTGAPGNRFRHTPSMAFAAWRASTDLFEADDGLWRLELAPIGLVELGDDDPGDVAWLPASDRLVISECSGLVFVDPLDGTELGAIQLAAEPDTGAPAVDSDTDRLVDTDPAADTDTDPTP
jgi:hypothetical protein